MRDVASFINQPPGERYSAMYGVSPVMLRMDL